MALPTIFFFFFFPVRLYSMIYAIFPCFFFLIAILPCFMRILSTSHSLPTTYHPTHSRFLHVGFTRAKIKHHKFSSCYDLLVFYFFFSESSCFFLFITERQVICLKTTTWSFVGHVLIFFFFLRGEVRDDQSFNRFPLKLKINGYSIFLNVYYFPMSIFSRGNVEIEVTVTW